MSARRWVVMAVTVPVVAVLAWMTVSRALASLYEKSDPALAVRLAGDPRALTVLSGRSLEGKGEPRDLAAAAEAATRALGGDALEEGALRNLALVADARGDRRTARAVMDRSALRGFRDPAAQAWLIQHDLMDGDLNGAFLRVDAVLRARPDLGPQLFPLLAGLADAPAATGPLARRLATNPPWRAPALAYLVDHTRDTAQVARLYQSLAATGHPPLDPEASGLLTRMVREGRFGEAYRLWAGLLPAGAGGRAAEPYDSGFAGLPGAAPFNWQLTDGPGVTVQAARPPGSEKTALRVVYPVANQVGLAAQLMVLAPGAYRFSGRVWIDQAAPGADLVWSVRCAGGANGAPLGEVRQAGDAATSPTPFSLAFTVPADCGAAWLTLVGRAGDGFGDLGAWYDSLALRPAA